MNKVDMSLDEIIKINKIKKGRKNALPGSSKRPYTTKKAMEKRLQKMPVTPVKQVKTSPNRQRNDLLNSSSPNASNFQIHQRQQLKTKNRPQLTPNQRNPNKNATSLPRKTPGRVQKMRRRNNVGQMSDAEVLKMARMLLTKRAGAAVLPTTEQTRPEYNAMGVAYSARQLRKERAIQANQTVPTTPRQQTSRQQTPRQQTPRQQTPRVRQQRNWARKTVVNPETSNAVLTISVRNELANLPQKKKLNRPAAQNSYFDGSSIIVETRNPQASFVQQQSRAQATTAAPEPTPVAEIVRHMKPKVETTYDFSKEVFAQAKTNVALNQRFSTPTTSAAATSRSNTSPASGHHGRQVFL